jgi:tetratricopeptide (TPR) repeat protein
MAEAVADVRPYRGMLRVYAAAAAVVAIAAAVLVLHRKTPLQQLTAAAAAMDVRPVDGWLLGFPHRARIRSRAAQATPDPTAPLRAAAARLLDEDDDSSDAGARRARAIALLVNGKEQAAIGALEDVVREHDQDAAAWSDLAAAHQHTGRMRENPHEFVLALAAADRALAIDRNMPEALFNRAVALESLGLGDASRAAFERARVAAAANPWAEEALDHVHALDPGAHSAWTREREALEAAVRNRDAERSQAIIRNHPQQARIVTEIDVLGAWGEAVRDGRNGDADAQIRLARVVATDLARDGGDRLLLDVVGAIDRAGGSARRRLAEAHAGYRAARYAFKARAVSEAQAGFTASGAEFEELRSPMAFVARCFEAAAYTDLQQPQRALDIVAAQLATAPNAYRAVRAHLLWQEGTARGTLGMIVESVAAYRASARLFRSLGETINTAGVEQMAATGDFAFGATVSAWQSMISVFRELSASEKEELQRALAGAAAGEEAEEHWDAVRSLVDLLPELGLTGVNPRRESNLWTRRAMASFHLRSGDSAADLGRARAAAQAVKAPGLHESALFDIRIAEATLAVDAQPERAVGQLTTNIAWAEQHEYFLRVPEQYLLRGRARAALGDLDEAEADFDAALERISARSAGLDSQSRAALLAAAGETAGTLAAALVDAGAAGRAFGVMERRSNVLAFGAPPPASNGERLPEGELLLRYVVLPDRLLLFALDRNGLTVHQRRMDRHEIDAAIDSVNEAAMSAIFLGPLRDRLASTATLVIVGDGAASRVPFAALRGAGGGPVIEHTRIVYTRSAGRYMASWHKAKDPARGGALVVGDPAFDQARLPQLTRLPSSERESADVARLYRTEALTGAAATDQRIAERLRSVSVFHFAGHAVVNEKDGRYSGLVAAPTLGTTGLMYLRSVEAAGLDGLEVAVLAGCRTAAAVGPRGASSLASSFVAAGARTAIGSLWDVDDDVTREFSLRLHSHLTRGTGAEEALRAVQLEFLHSDRPSLRAAGAWAGFQVWRG